MKTLAGWRRRAKALRAETFALYLACRDPRVRWYARALAVAVVAYAFSPIDLIPDPIPVLGYVDDLVLVPLGILLVLKLMPAAVIAECREKSREAMAQGRPTNWYAAAVVVAIWLLVAGLVAALITRAIRR